MTTEWNPNLGEKIGPAWRAVVANLKERDWGSENICIAIAQQAGDIRHKTAHNLIQEAIKNGHLEVRAISSGRKTRREIRLPGETN